MSNEHVSNKPASDDQHPIVAASATEPASKLDLTRQSATPTGFAVGRRDWLKTAMSASAFVAGAAAFSRAEAQEAATTKAAPAAATAADADTKGDAAESDTKAETEVFSTTLNLSSIAGDGLGAINVAQWQHGYGAVVDKGGVVPHQASTNAISHGHMSLHLSEPNGVSALHRAAWSGDAIATASLTVRQLDKPGGSTVSSYRADLENVVVSSIRTGIDGPDCEPTVTLGLGYERIRWTYEAATKAGTLSSTSGWNAEQKKKKKKK